MRKAWFYIKKLNEKGFTDEDIISKTHFHPGRYQNLKKIGTIPTTKEIRKLRSLLVLNTQKQRASALHVWRQPRVETPMDETPKQNKVKAKVFTDKQVEVLKTLEKEPTPLARTQAVVASSLRKSGLVKSHLNDNNRRVYELTDSGKVVAEGITVSSERSSSSS
mgnify:FL=1